MRRVCVCVSGVAFLQYPQLVNLTPTPAGVQLFELLIKVSISLLAGGNRDVQGAFLELMNANQSPLSDIMARLRQTVLDVRAESARVRSKRRRALGSDAPSLTEAEQMEAWVPSILSLKFLQALCEGHNTGLQNLLREQDSRHRPVNIVAAVCNLLHQMHDKLTKPMNALATQVCTFSPPIVVRSPGANVLARVQVLDTLIEMVQGPCAANQLTLVSNKFVEVVGSLLSAHGASSGRDVIEDTLTGATGVYVSKVVQYKCMVAIVALFEGHPDGLVYTRVASLLPLSVMKQNLTAIFSDFCALANGYYDDEAFLQPLNGNTVAIEVGQ